MPAPKRLSGVLTPVVVPFDAGLKIDRNRLLRQYLPKGTDLSQYSQAQFNGIARELNERPRKTLDFETPAERLNACVAATH